MLVIIGGQEDSVKQAIALAKRPHLKDSTKLPKEFNLRRIKFLVRHFDYHNSHSFMDIFSGTGRSRPTLRRRFRRPYRRDFESYS